MSKTIEITRVEDIQPGDHVTLVWNRDGNTTLSGVVHHIKRGLYTSFDVAGLRVALGGGWTVESATREVPDLPTEPGSVIVKATIRGVEGQTAILDPEGDWFTTTRDGYYWYLDPEDITAWEPARIVPEGGAS